MRDTISEKRARVDDRRAAGLLPERFKSPVYMMWEITYSCPLRCVHCYNSSGYSPPRHLGHDDAMKVAEQIADAEVMSICLTGGEPNLHPAYYDASRVLKEAGVSIGTPTSGWNMTPETADVYVELFDTVQVSVDAGRAETHDAIRGRNRSFQRAMAALRMLNDAVERSKSHKTPNLCLAYVANRRNIDEFVELTDQVADISRLTEIRLQAQVPSGRARELGLGLTDADLERLQQLAIRQTLKHGILVNAGDPTGHLKKAVLGWPWEYAVIDPYGDVRFSPWLPGRMGNVLESSLQEVWDAGLGDLHRDPDMVELLSRIRTVNDIGDVTEELESRYGSFGGGDARARRDGAPVVGSAAH
ncbi:radical SAM protein [Actinomadura fulvescens]|uniref:Radical SAM core domain-containing protein n=1 Tax=Actinomadura fulvescens TaxID=46160 RepID=A0ABN3PIL0_9ACTN